MGQSYSPKRLSYQETLQRARDVGGEAPSYGRILGLSQRLDKNISRRMRHEDAFQMQQRAMKELVQQQSETLNQFQKNALNILQ